MDIRKIIEIITAARDLHTRDAKRDHARWAAESDRDDALLAIDEARAALDAANETLARLKDDEDEVTSVYEKLVEESAEARALVSWVYRHLDADSHTVDRLVLLYEDEKAEQAEGGEE
jgi:hypothetical protein